MLRTKRYSKIKTAKTCTKMIQYTARIKKGIINYVKTIFSIIKSHSCIFSLQKKHETKALSDFEIRLKSGIVTL